MAGQAADEREATFRADVARLVQAVYHYLTAEQVPEEVAPLLEPVRHLAVLLDADAPAEHLREAALAVVDIYDWPSPDSSSSEEGLVMDPSVLAAVERLRTAIDAFDLASDENGEDFPPGQ